jgi:hypothetical protein
MKPPPKKRKVVGTGWGKKKQAFIVMSQLITREKAMIMFDIPKTSKNAMRVEFLNRVSVIRTLSSDRFNWVNRKDDVPEIVNEDILFKEIYRFRESFEHFIRFETARELLMMNKQYKRMEKKYSNPQNVVEEMFEFLRNPNFVLNKKKREIEAKNYSLHHEQAQFLYCNFLVPSLTDPSVMRNKTIVIPWDILNEIFSYINPYYDNYFNEDVYKTLPSLMCVNMSFYFQVLKLRKKITLLPRMVWKYPLGMLKNVTCVILTLTQHQRFDVNSLTYFKNAICQSIKNISSSYAFWAHYLPDVVFVNLTTIVVNRKLKGSFLMDQSKNLPVLRKLEISGHMQDILGLFGKKVLLGLEVFLPDFTYCRYPCEQCEKVVFENCKKVFFKGTSNSRNTYRGEIRELCLEFLKAHHQIQTVKLYLDKSLILPVESIEKMKRLVLVCKSLNQIRHSKLLNAFFAQIEGLVNKGKIEEYVIVMFQPSKIYMQIGILFKFVEFFGFDLEKQKKIYSKELLQLKHSPVKSPRHQGNRYLGFAEHVVLNLIKGIPEKIKTFGNIKYRFSVRVKKQKYRLLYRTYFRKLEISIKKL